MGCGGMFSTAGLLWLYILKNYPMHQVYPLTALAYLFGMLASIWVFGESIPIVRWIGVALIMVGCALILK